MNKAELKNISYLHLIFILLGGVVLLFIIAPLLNMYFKTPISDLAVAVKDKEVIESIWLTVWTSMLATILFAFMAIPLAYILARKNFPLKKLVNAVIDLPIIIPHSAAGIAVLGLVTRDSFLGQAGEMVGLKFVGNPAGIMIAMAFVSIPFLINSARDGFASVPERLEKVALSLGASPARVFFTISLPLAWRSILSGLVLMWGRGMSEFGAVIIIAYNPMITPVLIFERFTSYGLKYSTPVAVIFVSVCLFIFILMRLIKKNVKN